MKGFKSFPQRTKLDFAPGVSVVVGPNGSGKSNITDAVLWALGEQSPLAVRGQTMKDVIFAGAYGIQGSSAAEVEVVIDNHDGALDLDFSEISIVRRLGRDGEGEYRLNGARCRLVDVVEVLSDSGLGKEMHSVVSQGKVEQIVLSRPRDRRLMIEEAAGLGKHRKRRRRAQLKLERTEENLSRALDVEREARSRLRPLKRQAEAAELHERLERQSLEARMELCVDELRAQLERAQQRRAELEAGVERARAELASAEASAEAARRRRHEAEHAADAARGRAAQAAAELAAIDRFPAGVGVSPGTQQLADGPHPQGGYELALAAVLGPRLVASVVDDLAAGQALLEAAGDAGGTALVSSRTRGRLAGRSPGPGAQRLLAHVRPESWIAKLAERLLADVWVVESLEHVSEYFDGIAVTRRGRMLDAARGELTQAPAGGAERLLGERSRRQHLREASALASREEAVAQEELEATRDLVAESDAAREEAETALRRALRAAAEAPDDVERSEWLIGRRRDAPEDGLEAVRC